MVADSASPHSVNMTMLSVASRLRSKPLRKISKSLSFWKRKSATGVVEIDEITSTQPSAPKKHVTPRVMECAEADGAVEIVAIDSTVDIVAADDKKMNEEKQREQGKSTSDSATKEATDRLSTIEIKRVTRELLDDKAIPASGKSGDESQVCVDGSGQFPAPAPAEAKPPPLSKSAVELVKYMSQREGRERGFEVLLDDFTEFLFHAPSEDGQHGHEKETIWSRSTSATTATESMWCRSASTGTELQNRRTRLVKQPSCASHVFGESDLHQTTGSVLSSPRSAALARTEEEEPVESLPACPETIASPEVVVPSPSARSNNSGSTVAAKNTTKAGIQHVESRSSTVSQSQLVKTHSNISLSHDDAVVESKSATVSVEQPAIQMSEDIEQAWRGSCISPVESVVSPDSSIDEREEEAVASVASESDSSASHILSAASGHTGSDTTSTASNVAQSESSSTLGILSESLSCESRVSMGSRMSRKRDALAKYAMNPTLPSEVARNCTPVSTKSDVEDTVQATIQVAKSHASSTSIDRMPYELASNALFSRAYTFAVDQHVIWEEDENASASYLEAAASAE